MEFILNHLNGGNRLGRIILEGFSFSTPNFILSSKSGSVPYLSIDILEKFEIIPTIIQMPLDGLINSKNVIQKYNKGINNFTALQSSPIYCCLHDPSAEMMQGFNDVGGVALWGKSGKTKVDCDSYMEFIESLQPALFQALIDASTDETSSYKRIRKSVDRSIDYLDKCVSKKNNSKNLKRVKIIGTIVGGFNEKERIRCATEINNKDVFGFSFDGFDINGSEISDSKFNSILKLISTIMPILNKNKPRIFAGILNLQQIILGTKSGIDIFDSSYVYFMTERNCALTVNLDYCNHKKDDIQEFIDLSDKKYFQDFSQLSLNCNCYSCQNYTRSYLHHLVVTKELLAPILLFIHNLKQFENFFDKLKYAIQNDELELFQNYFKTF